MNTGLSESGLPNATSPLRLRNLRDLGGLPTRRRDLVVATQRFFRSSAPSRFAPDEKHALASLDLQCVFDIRTTAELAHARLDAVPPSVQIFHLPFFETVRQNWISPPDQSPQATALRYLEMLEDGLPSLAALVLQVARPSAAPFLVSCTAGRDRTGIVVACILDLLDISDDAIAADYAESDSFDPDSGRAHAPTIVGFLQLLRNRHGSVHRLVASHGVSDSDVAALRHGLLTRPEAPAA